MKKLQILILGMLMLSLTSFGQNSTTTKTSRWGTFIQDKPSFETGFNISMPRNTKATIIDSIIVSDDMLGWDMKWYKIECSIKSGWVLENTFNAPVYGEKKTYKGKSIVPIITNEQKDSKERQKISEKPTENEYNTFVLSVTNEQKASKERQKN
jgi:hypothetical protein